jgi:hypothetical protein
MLEGTEDNWSFLLLHFVEGDIHALISFIENFRKSDDYDRYICIGSLGDGRVLRAAPSWKRLNGAYVVQCPTFQAFPRRSAFELGGDFALSADNDLIVENGDIALVRGVAALPQKIRLTLSRQRGLDPFYKKFGTRIAEYYSLLRNSVWLEQLIKLELIRMASIPYPDPTLKQRDTPLQCVERVFGLAVAGEASSDGWLPLKVELDVKGLGRWTYDSSAFVKNIKPRLSPEETFR